MAYKYDVQQVIVNPTDNDVSLKATVPLLFKNAKQFNDWGIQILNGEGVGLRFLSYPLPAINKTPNVDIDITYPKYLLIRQFPSITIDGYIIQDIAVSGSQVMNTPDAAGVFNPTKIQILLIGQ